MNEEKPSIKQGKKLQKQEKTIPSLEKEIGGFEDQGLLEPTRYNDWEVKGRCSDF